MNEPTNTPAPASVTRRSFLKTSTTAVAGGALLGALPVERFALGASPGDTIKLALVGCGGRGRGAIAQALLTEGPVKLVAMADAFDQGFDTGKKNLFNPFDRTLGEVTRELSATPNRDPKDRIAVKQEKRFIGFDAYKEAIAEADVVILATPPGLRPMQFEEAIRQGKHVFMEKPVASDAPGVRRVLAAAEEAKKKNLKVGVGLQRHHQLGYQETIQRLHDGAIGDIVAGRVYWNGTTPWVKARADLEREFGRPLTEMEYQVHNWYYFTWLSGDHIAEQHIHNLDVWNWVKKGYPVRANGMGGVEVRKGKDYGEIFDHHAVEFEYADGTRLASQCRHINGCWSDVSEHAVGSKGTCNIGGHTIRGENAWKFRGGGKNPYEQEHDDLFAAIRNDKPYNEAENGAKSTMTAILGRMATYSGKVVEWDQAINSKIELVPKSLAWDAKPPTMPGPDGMYPHAVPGKTVVI